MTVTAAHRMALETRSFRGLDRLGLLANTWSELQHRSTNASVFSTWQWNHAAARHFWRTDAPRVTLVADSGTPIAILPLAHRRIVGMKGLVFLGTGPFDYGRADYQDALIKDGWETVACGAFVDELANAPGDWDVLMLQDLPARSRLLSVLPGMAQDKGWPVSIEPDNDVYFIALPQTWDEYTATLSTNVRSNMGRKQRKLEREHNARFERVEALDQLDEALDLLFDLHNHRWQEKQGTASAATIFSEAAARDFHREVARNLLSADMLDLVLLRTDDGVIGARYGFDFAGSKSFYASGYRTDEDWSKFSLGAIMDLQSIQASIESGLQYEDLLRNEGKYKARYAPQRSDNQRLYIFRTRQAQLRFRASRSLKRTARVILRSA